MKKIILLYKKEGETPLQALNVFRSKHKIYKDVKMTYAGRLDPMASGLLLVLIGEECKNKEKYLNLNKEYKFQVLFGFSTDTHDVLGKVDRFNVVEHVGMRELEKNIKANLKKFTGKFVQKYPAYSSKTVKGKPLFEYAREGVEVERGSREVMVKSLKFEKCTTISSKKLLENIQKRIKKVRGDFRQKEILKIWQKKLGNKKSKFFLASFYVKCGTGVYVRVLARNLGENLNMPALAFSIKRTKIGKWSKMSK